MSSGKATKKTRSVLPLLALLSGGAFGAILFLLIAAPLIALGITRREDLGAITFVGILLGATNGYWMWIVHIAKKDMERHRRIVKGAVVKYLKDIGNKQEEKQAGGDQIQVMETTYRKFVRIPGTTRWIGLVGGLEEEHLTKLKQSRLKIVSQRALSESGVITREPGASVNAKILLEWLHRNGLVEPVGNHRYGFTRIGKDFMRQPLEVGSPPPPHSETTSANTGY